MAEISIRFGLASLRRHYPHQVQGVVQPDLSAITAPPHFHAKLRLEEPKSTRESPEVRRQSSDASRLTGNE